MALWLCNLKCSMFNVCLCALVETGFPIHPHGGMYTLLQGPHCETHPCLSPTPKIRLTLVPFTGLGSLIKPEKASLGVESDFVMIQMVKDVALESETWFDSDFPT